MGLLGWLFKTRKRPLKSRQAPEELDTSFTISSETIRDDGWFTKNQDIIDGYEFVATLNFRTPLQVLEHHRERRPGPPSALPQYGTTADGMWLPRTKSWGDLLGIDDSELDKMKSSMASQIGPVPGDGGDFLPFLKIFRRTVEGSQSVEEKIIAIKKELAKYPGRNKIEEIMGPFFAENWFIKELTAIPGIGKKTAANLFRAGFRDIESLRTVETKDLKMVPGVGPKIISSIRKFFNLA